MAIQINGNGTITGISSGGLPAGSVTTATLADGAVTAAKRGAGAILQIVQVAPSGGSGTSFSTTQTSGQHVSALDTSITPIATGSKLFVMINIRTQNDSSSDVNSRHSLNMARTIGGGS